MRLLGVLLSIGLVLGLTVFVMNQVNSEEKKTAKSVGVQVLPGGVVVPDTDPDPVTGGGAVDPAKTVACATTAQSLRGAEDSYRVLNGVYADLPTLVSSGSIRQPSTVLYTIESADGFATYKLVGQAGCP